MKSVAGKFNYWKNNDSCTPSRTTAGTRTAVWKALLHWPPDVFWITTCCTSPHATVHFSRCLQLHFRFCTSSIKISLHLVPVSEFSSTLWWKGLGTGSLLRQACVLHLVLHAASDMQVVCFLVFVWHGVDTPHLNLGTVLFNWILCYGDLMFDTYCYCCVLNWLCMELHALHLPCSFHGLPQEGSADVGLVWQKRSGNGGS